jgi:4-hydroxythreonine-4-phosphate dehydrogenase
MSRPLVAVTMGDPAGVGPEVCLAAAADARVQRCCVPVIFGDWDVLERVAGAAGRSMPGRRIPARQWTGACGLEDAAVVDVAAVDAARLVPGRVQAEAGRAAYAYIDAAIRAAMSGRVAGIATAPIHKQALHAAGIALPGHTEILAQQTGASRYCMMLTAPEITVSLVTTHLAMREVAGRITRSRVAEVLALTHDAMRRMRGAEPRLTVCAYNPHAGEEGLFGQEEADAICPAIEEARARGWQVCGPLPPDTAFVPSRREATDAYVVMYHDQGLIPFKMLAFDHGVNVTLGLPIVRTSVDHGTAFDIAWQGRASAESMVASICLAVALARPAAQGTMKDAP